jgi:hypothetical protein
MSGKPFRNCQTFRTKKRPDFVSLMLANPATFQSSYIVYHNGFNLCFASDLSVFRNRNISLCWTEFTALLGKKEREELGSGNGDGDGTAQ